MPNRFASALARDAPAARRIVLACFGRLLLTHRRDIAGASGRNWSSTEQYIPPGTLLQLSAVGRVDIGAGLGSYGPEGTSRFADGPGDPAETRTRYGLVARLTARNINPGQNEDGLYEQWAYGDMPGNRYYSVSSMDQEVSLIDVTAFHFSFLLKSDVHLRTCVRTLGQEIEF